MRFSGNELDVLSAGLIIIGNEILAGHTLDTNSNWLCRQLTTMGIEVRRIVTVPDFGNAVIEVIQESLYRDWYVLITSGGLGPTYDDSTLASVAKAVGKELRLHHRALELVKQRYDDLAGKGLVPDNSLTPPRVKMAMMPVGAYPLRNNVGTAPGMYLRIRRENLPDLHLFSLPGVPKEMKDIFQHQVIPILKVVLNLGAYYEIRCNVGVIVESDLAPYLKEIARRHPRVYVKSTPQGHLENKKSGMLVMLSARGKNMDDVKKLVLAARDDLISSLGLDAAVVSCEDVIKTA